MNKNRTLVWFAIASAAALSACANPGIVEVAPDQYMVSRLDPGGMVGNAAALKARMIKEANDFAEKKGKRAVPVPLDELPGFPSCNPQVVEYNFRIVDPQQAVAVPPPAAAAANAPQVDRLADGILRLDQLRKQGLLSDSEFQAQKLRLLQAQ